MAKQATKEVKDNLNGNTLNVSSKIDAIKELIFGENIQAYNSEFEAVKADILAKKKELQHLIDDVKSELMQSIDSLSTDVNIRITDLEDSLNDKIESLDDTKVNRTLLSNLFIKLGEKIGE
ncbi:MULTISPECIES: fructose 1,6-bisphosphatase [Flavobacteriaceae]|uniref:fructose 1,6-bisphosphatase n=1 Tax=Flavobacteriaceae TaxID=49546 RepID=UPI001421BEF3|nr:fructose 1,6-bisphosphatase [Yeosuana marina]